MELENEDLKKTIKLKKNENVFVSVRRKNKHKSIKNYLRPTASSINKTTQKFINRPYSSSSNITNLSKTIQLSRRTQNVNTSNKNRMLSKSQNSTIYYDNLHHFDSSDNLGYDPYGHFS